MTEENEPIIKIQNLYKEFVIDDTQVEVLKNINLEIYPGEFVVIYGHSGCGKSTLLNTIMGLEKPTRGSVDICTRNIYNLNEDGRAKFRQKNFGIVMQQSSWIRSLNVVENVAYPLLIAGATKKAAISAAKRVISHIGMSKYKKHMPNKLSGGQQQKIAMCRAIVANSHIIIADEPTGNLDTVSGDEVMDNLKKINEKSGRTILMVSHNQEYEKYATKVIHMKDGVIEKVVNKKSISDVNSKLNDRISLANKTGHLQLQYIVRLALKSLFSHKMRTLLTSSGVAISVGFVMFLLSLGMGLQNISINQVANIDAMKILDVSVAKSNILKLDDEILGKIKTVGNVENAQPQVSSASKLTYGKSEIEGVVYGENSEYLKMDDVKITDGKTYSSNSSNEVIISQAAQDQLSSETMVGKEISLNILVLSNLLTNEQSTKQFTKTLKVVGVTDEKAAVIAYTPLQIFKDNDVSFYSNIKVQMNSREAVAQGRIEIENLGYKVESIKETVEQIDKFFGMFQLILVFGGSIAIIVASIGMFNTLTITLVEKTKEIGFMKTIGTVRRDIYWLFTLESVIIGLLGSIIGIVISISAGKLINSIISNIAKETGNKPVDLFYLPIYIPLIILSIAFGISVLTSFYPSRRAAHIKPLDAMRYE